MSKRFDRHQLIPGWHQQQLTDARIVVVGMGALGNEVTRILAMAGVGRMIICDMDIIEESNLSRTLLFRPSDIGCLKVTAAATALAKLAPGINIEARPLPFVHGVGLAELREASLVLGCLDSRMARLELAGRCQLIGANYIDGGTHPWGGEIRPYLNPEGPCYGCSLSIHERAIADVPWSCLDEMPEMATGAAVPSSALVGTWMGAIATRFLMGQSYPQGTLRIDAAMGTTMIVEQRRDPECPLHLPIDNIRKIGVSVRDQMRQLRNAIPQDTVPLAWNPVQRQVECKRCNFSETRWGLPTRAACPQCKQLLYPRTTLELDKVPDTMPLADLGIAPREILAIRMKEGFQWVELEQ